VAEPVRVGVVGTGTGTVHIEVFQRMSGVEVVGVCSARPERAAAVAERFSLPVATDDYGDLLSDGIDAVVVATPPASHAEIGLAAIAAGKHVLMEKPFTPTLGEARALRDAARDAGIVHMMNLQDRFIPAYWETHRFVQSGYLGKLVAADILVARNPRDYLSGTKASDSKLAWFTDGSQGGGILANSNGPHLVDRLRWLCGPVVEVAAETFVGQPNLTLKDGRRVENITAPDGFAVLLRFANGAVGTLRGVPIPYHGDTNGLELHGDRGSLVVGPDLILRGATSEDQGLKELPVPGDPDERLTIATRFVEAIQRGGPAPNPNFDDGFAMQAILDATQRAASSGRWEPVEME
jgi:predicted dehydrogenase